MDDFIKKNITVVIPTYNAEKTIYKTLDDVSKIFQKIIIVDANSKDLTKNICDKFAIPFFTSKKNHE